MGFVFEEKYEGVDLQQGEDSEAPREGRPRSLIRIRPGLKPIQNQAVPRKQLLPPVSLKARAPKPGFLRLPKQDALQELYKTSFRGFSRKEERLGQLRAVLEEWRQEQQGVERQLEGLAGLGFGEYCREGAALLQAYCQRVDSPEVRDYLQAFQAHQQHDPQLAGLLSAYDSSLQGLRQAQGQLGQALQIQPTLAKIARTKALSTGLRVFSEVARGRPWQGAVAGFLVEAARGLFQGRFFGEVLEEAELCQEAGQVLAGLGGLELAALVARLVEAAWRVRQGDAKTLGRAQQIKLWEELGELWALT